MHPATAVQPSEACKVVMSADADRMRRKHMSDVLEFPAGGDDGWGVA